MAPTGQSDIFSVSALTDLVRGKLENSFPFVWVRGEVTDLARPHSGHIYFSLKDSRAVLQCVWLTRKQERAARRNFDPLTGEVYDAPVPPAHELLKNGVEFLCAGSLGVYAPRGQYQLNVEFAQAAGEGALAREFELRKARLAAAGYFESSRKRPLPQNPQKVALITSPRGAAIHDFLELSRSRGIKSIFRLFPVPVQGCDAADKIAAAIEEANTQGWAEAIVLIRGGGSLEDLWSFNEEIVAKSIYNSSLPVLAGIGHEVDFTLADLTADQRAATPSHAAQLLLAPRVELEQKLDGLELALDRQTRQILDMAARKLDQYANTLKLLSPDAKLQRHEKTLLELERSLRREKCRWLASRFEKLDALDERLKKCSGLRQTMRFNSQRIEWLNKNLKAAIDGSFPLHDRALEKLTLALRQAATGLLARYERALENMENALKANNPFNPLRKGYALLYDDDGKLIRSINTCSRNSPIRVRLVDGMLNATVNSKIEIKGNANDV